MAALVGRMSIGSRGVVDTTVMDQTAAGPPSLTSGLLEQGTRFPPSVRAMALSIGLC